MSRPCAKAVVWEPYAESENAASSEEGYSPVVFCIRSSYEINILVSRRDGGGKTALMSPSPSVGGMFRGAASSDSCPGFASEAETWGCRVAAYDLKNYVDELALDLALQYPRCSHDGGFELSSDEPGELATEEAVVLGQRISLTIKLGIISIVWSMFSWHSNSSTSISLTWRWHVVFAVIGEKNHIHFLPALLLRPSKLLSTSQLSFLSLIKTLDCLFSPYLAALQLSEMVRKLCVVREYNATPSTADWQSMPSIYVFSVDY
jgi:hypothetical protein